MALAAFAFGAEAASTYYVDVRGDDSWTGTADWDHRDTSVTPAIGPIRTLANISNLVTATTTSSTVGDTVYLAEGDYDYGSNAAGTYRAVLPNGTRLIGVGDRNKIRIFGSATDETATVGENPMRCLQLGSWVLVKGVTLCNGRTTGGGGAAFVASGATGPYVVACVISNNYAQGRGGALGALASGAAIRCLFTKNNSGDTGKCVYATTCWNCVFDQVGMDDGGQYAANYLLYYAASYNCTFVGGGGAPRGNPNSHYNMLSLVRDSGNSNTTMYRSLFALAEKRSANGGGSQWGVGADRLQLEGSYVPIQGANLGYDYGSNAVYTANFPTSALVADQKDLDFNGNTRIQGAAIDCGACEADPSIRHLVVADAQTGLTVEGAAIGTTVLAPGESVTVRISRNYSTEKLCTGVSVNGEFFSFTGEDSDRVYERTYSAEDPVPYLKIEAVYAEHNDWYVDAVNGDDGRDGYTKYRSKRTLAAALTNELVKSGDVVHAAEGLYNKGETMVTGSTSNRAEVAAGVGLVADGLVANTIIEGVPAKNLDVGNPTAVRCVSLGTGAYVKGFTLRNGSTRITGQTNGKGGGVSGNGEESAAIDCIITNCTAVRGGGAYYCSLIRCQVCASGTESGSSAGGTAASPAAAGVLNGWLYDTYVDNEVYDPYRVVNSFVDTKLSRAATSGSVIVYNSYVNQVSQRSGATIILSNCVYLTSTGTTVVDAKTSTLVTSAPRIDSVSRRPIRGVSDILIDAGVAAYHVYPSSYASEAGTDLAGGQRVYNGQIDIGCGEYDWRGDFTRQLAVKGVEVTAAGANVTTNDLAGLVLSDGDALKLKIVAKVAGQGSFKVTVADEGTVTAELDGTPLVGEEGVYVVDFSAGESELKISFAGAGTATLSDVVMPKSGLMLICR